MRAPAITAACIWLAAGLQQQPVQGESEEGGCSGRIVQLLCNTVPGPHLWENYFLGVPTGSQEDYTNQCRCRGQGLSSLLKNRLGKNQGGVFSSGGDFLRAACQAFQQLIISGVYFFKCL